MPAKVEEYIKRQSSPQKEILNFLRGIILETYPSIEEKMKWGVPTYGSDQYYLVALKDHVNMGFSINNLTEEEINNFEGSGKTMRHLQFRNFENINKQKIISLMELVFNK